MNLFNNIYSYLKNNPALIIIIIFALTLSAYLVRLQLKLGVAYWDIFLYLNNALMYAGLGEGSITQLPPLLSFLTSLFFRLGYVKASPLYLISGLIFASGIIGLYLLLKLRFSTKESVAGSIIFSSFTVVLSWAATGSLDVPAVCLAIWLTYVLLYGFKKDQRALILVFPLAFLTFFTRYTSGLMILPLGFYFLTIILEGQLKKDHLLKLALGFLIGLLILAPVMGFFYSKLGTPVPFLNLLEGSVANDPAQGDPAYLPGKSYYINHFPQYISSYPVNDSYATMLYPSLAQTNMVSYLILIIAGAGLLIYAMRYIWCFKNFKTSKRKKALVLVAGIILSLLFIFTLQGNSYLPAAVTMLALIFLIYYSTKNQAGKNSSLDMLMLIWFLTYFISHSFLIIKVDRYFITTTPALAYLLILGFNQVQDKLSQLSKKKISAGLLAIILALLLLFSSIQPYAYNVPRHIYGDLETAGNLMKDYDPDYQDKVIYSDYWPAMSWHLKMNVKRGWPKNFEDNAEFSRMLLENNTTYFINYYSDPPLNLTGFVEVQRVANIIIFERVEGF